jgi:hypothetical protein
MTSENSYMLGPPFMWRCASSFGAATYTKEGLLPQDSLTLPLAVLRRHVRR